MLDRKFLLNNKEAYIKNCEKRNIENEYEKFTQLNSAYTSLLAQQEEIRAQQNKIKTFNEDAKNLKEKFNELSEQTSIAEKKLYEWLIYQPNILLDEVPFGKTEKENKAIFESQDFLGNKNKDQKHHDDLIENLILKEGSIKLSGSRFLVMKQALSKLKRTLSDFMIESNAQEGYQEYTVPYLVNEECLFGTGQLPKFAEDAFCTVQKKWLISTGEISLVNMFRDTVFAQNMTPQLCMTFTPCFRSEAGAAGKDTKGMIRLHQFHKVELVTLCKEEDANAMHEKQLQTACKILEALKLQHQILFICSGDTGFTATKQYDIEVWMPGLKRYVEIASCSQCGTFQAIRANIRYKNEQGKTQHVHTLNGSSLPIERLIAAIVENYAQADGSILIPEILQEKMQAKIITSNGCLE